MHVARRCLDAVLVLGLLFLPASAWAVIIDDGVQGTFTGLFEGLVHDEGVFLQILGDAGKREYFHCSKKDTATQLRDSVGLRLTVHYTTTSISTPAEQGDDVVERKDVDKVVVHPGSVDKVLNETRLKAEMDDGKAANTLGVWYEKGKHGLPKDPAEAFVWYQRAAQLGNPLAMHNLGDCYRDGVGVALDQARAFSWYGKAAEAGHAIGFEDLGDCYRDGIGVSADPEEAARLYQKAAAMGRKGAKEKLGKLRGRGK